MKVLFFERVNSLKAKPFNFRNFRKENRDFNYQHFLCATFRRNRGNAIKRTWFFSLVTTNDHENFSKAVSKDNPVFCAI